LEIFLNIQQALQKTIPLFEEAKIDTPRLDAELLLAETLGKSRAMILSHPEVELSDKECGLFEKWVDRRRKREPIAYILGKKEFWSLEFRVNQNVLIPRPETEILVEKALDILDQEEEITKGWLVDVGTGSGAIAISLLREIPNLKILATDISFEALEVAKVNAKSLLENHSLIEFVLLDGLEELSISPTLIVANPPYSNLDDRGNLPPEVRNFEPLHAVSSKDHGFYHIERLIHQSAAKLMPGGYLVMEIGYGQEKRVRELLHQYFPGHYSFHPDLASVTRVVVACKER
jgi:release factor glutamine methyltransferase